MEMKHSQLDHGLDGFGSSFSFNGKKPFIVISGDKHAI